MKYLDYVPSFGFGGEYNMSIEKNVYKTKTKKKKKKKTLHQIAKHS